MANTATVGILRVLLTANAAEYETALKKAASAAQVWERDLKKIGQQATAVGASLTKAVTLPIVALGASSIKAAMDFESSFAGVRKTVKATEPEFASMSQQFRDLAKEIPVNVNELNRLAESAGAMDIPKDAIVDFTRVMALLGVTTNVTAEQAATDIGKIQNIFGAAGKDTDRFAATLVALGNEGASTEQEILSMATRIAAAGNTVGMTQGQVLAFGSALSSVGLEAEAGGTAISRTFFTINDAVMSGGAALDEFARVAGMSAEQFKKAFQDDAASATTAFITGLARIKGEGENVNQTLKGLELGEIRVRDTLIRAAGAGDLLTKALNLQATAWRDNTALTKEAAERFKTFESQLALVWNQIKDVGITLGTALLPALQDLLTLSRPLIDTAGQLAKWFAAMPEPLRLVALGVGALVAAIGPALVITGHLITALGTVIGAFAAKGIAVRTLTALMPPLTIATSAQTAATYAATAANAVFGPGMLVVNRAALALTGAITTNTAAMYLSATAARVTAAAKSILSASLLAVSLNVNVLIARLGMSTAAQYASAAASRVATFAAGTLATALSTLSVVAVGVGAAFAGWQIGRWIGEWTGLTDAVGKATAKVGEFIGILPAGAAAQYDMSRAAAKNREELDKLGQSVDAAKGRLQQLKDQLSGVTAAKNIQELAKATLELAQAGELTTPTAKRIAESITQIRVEGQQLPPILQNIVDAYGSQAIAARSAAVATGEHGSRLAEVRGIIASFTAVQKTAIQEGHTLGDSNEKIATSLKLTGVSAENAEAAVRLYLDGLKSTGKTAEQVAEGPLKKFRTRVIEVNAQLVAAAREGGRSYQIALEELGDTLIDVGRRAEMFGEALPEELELAVKIATNKEDAAREIERLRDSMQMWLETRPLQLLLQPTTGPRALDLTKTWQPYAAALGKMVDGVWQPDKGNNQGVAYGRSILGGISDALQGLPDILTKAFTGGGGLLGALKAMGVQIADSIATPLMERIKALGPQIAGRMNTAIGLGTGGAAAIGGAFGGSTGATIASIASSMGGLVLATTAWGASMAAAGVAGSLALGAATAGIGAAAVGVYMLARRWFSVSKDIKEARKAVEEFQDQLGQILTPQQKAEAGGEKWKETILAVGRAYVGTGRSAEEARQAVEALWDTDNPLRAQRAMQDIANVMKEFGERVKVAETAFDHIMEAAEKAGGVIPAEMRDTINAFISLGLLTEDQIAQLQRLGDQSGVSFQQMQDAIDVFKGRVESLGPAFNQQRLDQISAKYVNALDTLARGGADVGGFLHDAREELSELAFDSIKHSATLPKNLEPFMRNLFETGQLIDADGNKLEDFASLKFGDAIETEAEIAKKAWEEITAAIRELIAEIRGPLLGAIEKIPREVPIHFVGEFTPPEWQTQPVPFATGGLVTRPTFALLGEAGPELVVPLSGAFGNIGGALREAFDFKMPDLAFAMPGIPGNRLDGGDRNYTSPPQFIVLPVIKPSSIDEDSVRDLMARSWPVDMALDREGMRSQGISILAKAVVRFLQEGS